MSKPSSSLLQFIRMVGAILRKDDRCDSELLASYAESHDDDAFAALVVRHGAMVWRICKRILGDNQDAEDALQSAFAILARNAKKIRTGSAAGWLHQVARRTALDARRTTKSQQKLKERLQELALADQTSGNDEGDVYEALHEEVAKLPEKLRAPLVLHYLEGATEIEVARVLGIAERTVRDRLARGKFALKNQLDKRGIMLGMAALGPLLTGSASQAVIPSQLVGKIVRSATAFRDGTLTGGIAELAKQVLKQPPAASSWWMKGWLIAVVCVSGLLGAGTGVVVWNAAPEVRLAALTQKASQKPVQEKPHPIRLDAFGDPLPDGALARIGTLRFRHNQLHPHGDREFVAFGPNGKTLLTCRPRGSSAALQVWETATGKEIRHINGIAPGKFQGMAVSADGRQLAAFGGNGTQYPDGRKECNDEVWSWDVQSAPARIRWKAISKDRANIEAVTFSLDGKMVACGSSAHLFLLDAATGKELRKVDVKGDGPCNRLEFTPDGKTLAMWGFGWDGDGRQNEGKSIHLWDVASGFKLHTLAASEGVSSFTFSPDGSMLAVAYDDKIVRLWDVQVGAQVRQWELGEGMNPDTILAYLPDGKTLLATEHERVRFLDPATGKDRRPALACLGLFGRIPRSILTVEPPCWTTLSSDGRWLASANPQSVSVWDLTTGKEAGPAGMPNYFMSAVAFSPDGKKLATDMMPGVIQLWDATTGKLLQRLNGGCLEHGSSGWDGLRYTDDGRLYTFRTEDHRVALRGTLIGWNRERRAVQLAHDIPIQSGWAVTLDGRLAAGTQGSDITLYDLATGKELRKLQDKGGRWSPFLAFSDDGRSLVALKAKALFTDSKEPQTLAVWDVATGRRRLGGRQIDIETEWRLSRGAGNWRPVVAFSPDGRWLAAATRDPSIQLWELASGAVGPRFPIHTPNILCLAFGPDGRTLAVGWEESVVQLWDPASGRELRRFVGHSGPVQALAFSPDGARLASCSHDCTALIWDLRHLPRPGVATKDRPKPAALWAALTGKDAAAAYRAICLLSEAPDEALPLLRERLRPSARVAPKQASRWLADLKDNRFKIRNQAFAELEKRGPAAEEAVQQALKQKQELEVRRRLEGLLDRLCASPHWLSAIRGVEVLERIGSPEAERLLADLAQRGDGVQAPEARAALERLAKCKVATAPRPGFAGN